MTQAKIYTMPFSKVYPLYVAKAEKKSRTKEEVDQIIEWLTGYSHQEIENHLESHTTVEDFFNQAHHFNPSSVLIKGVVCGVRVENLEDPLMQKIRYLDKLVDELAKGKAMSKILRASIKSTDAVEDKANDTPHEVNRCPWAREGKLNQLYHDHEWGVPQHDDQKLFEMLCLEGAQAGLSWITVLKKRDHYLKLFDDFDPQKVAHYTDDYLDECLKDPGIIRHRGKVYSIRSNALSFHEVVAEWGSFDAFIWSFVEGNPIINHYTRQEDVPASTPISDAMSKALKKKGFKFCGSTICYAYMQAVGMVNDHLISCDRYRQLQANR